MSCDTLLSSSLSASSAGAGKFSISAPHACMTEQRRNTWELGSLRQNSDVRDAATGCDDGKWNGLIGEVNTFEFLDKGCRNQL
nr:hypothetical protein CFP56_04208 [Quercus suber]